MDELLRNKGIDTEYERSKVEYRPKIEYKKEYVPPSDTFRPSPRLLEEREVKVSEISRRSEVAGRRMARIENLIDERMKDDVVYVDPEEYPEAAEEGITEITFNDYKDALARIAKLTEGQANRDKLVVEIYEDFHENNMEGRIEVEAYKSLVYAKLDYDRFSEFIDKALIGELGLSGKSHEEIMTSEQQVLSEWESLERRKASLERTIQRKLNTSLSIDQLAELSNDQLSQVSAEMDELNRVNRDIRRYELYPSAKLKALAQQKIDSWMSFVNTTENTLLKTTYDFLGGSIKCMVSKLISQNSITLALEEKDLDEVRRILEEGDSQLAAVEMLLKVTLADKSSAAKVLGESILEILRAPITTLVNSIIVELLRLRREATQPVMDWLDSVSSIGGGECWAFDVMANLAIDGIESIEKNITGNIMELYKTIYREDILRDQKIESMEEKQTIRSSYKVIRATRKLIKSMLDALDKLGRESVPKMVDDIIKENGFNLSYDPLKKETVEKD